MCAVDATPKACITANNQMTGGFVGMIFGFFTALFGASLVVPSVLMKMSGCPETIPQRGIQRMVKPDMLQKNYRFIIVETSMHGKLP